jgi:hypothetical protein
MRGTSVEAMRSTKVEAMRSTRVEAVRSTSVQAMRSTRVEAMRSTSVEAMRSTRVEAMRSTSVEAMRSTRVEANKSTGVEAMRSTGVETMRSTRVEAISTRVEPKSYSICPSCRHTKGIRVQLYPLLTSLQRSVPYLTLRLLWPRKKTVPLTQSRSEHFQQFTKKVFQQTIRTSTHTKFTD